MLREQERDSLVVTVEQLPPPHVGVMTLRLCVPVVSQVLAYPPQAPQLPYVTLPHDAPLVLRVQERDSLLVTEEQPPPLQTGVMTLRLCVPVVSQVLEYPPQAPQLPYVTLPHDVPLVLREQERDSLVVTVEQLPPPHVGVMTLRLCVPVVSQVLSNPPQAPQLPVVTVPHDVPLVLRVQERDSLVVTVEQLPPPQVGVMTLRLCVPVVSQVLSNPPQAPQLPVVTVPHDVPLVLREQASVSVDIPSLQLPLPHTGVVTVRDRVPVSSHVPLKPPHALQLPADTLPHEAPSVPRMHPRDSEDTCGVQLPV